MRELTIEEMGCVSGGLQTGDTWLPGTTTTVDLPPPVAPIGNPSGGPRLPGGGGGGVPGKLYPQTIQGLERIKNELGIDLTEYAKMSPTLGSLITIATGSFNWHFDFAPNGQGSSAESGATIAVGTIHIDSAYRNNPLALVQQLSHELEHVNHRLFDDPRKESSTTYVHNYLVGEGYATLANEQVRAEIIKAGGQDIGIATFDAQHTRPIYDAQYARTVSNPALRADAAEKIGTAYGQYETTGGGKTYMQYYLDAYHARGGTH